MKKFAALLLIFVFILSFAACSRSEEVEQGAYFYTPSDGSFGTGATVLLYGKGYATIYFSLFSDYIGFGTYDVSGDTLVVNTDDGNFHYAFKIVEDGLKFDAAHSSNMTWGSTFTDGDIFVFDPDAY